MRAYEYIRDVVKNALSRRNVRYYAWSSGRKPILKAGNKDIYMSDFVNNAIDRIATETSKVTIRSVIEDDEGLASLQRDDITKLFKYKPNPLQTTKDFVASLVWIMRKNGNVFVYPQYDVIRTQNGQEYKRFKAFYPLNPISVRIGLGADNKLWEIEMTMPDGNVFAIPYNRLIHMRWRRGTHPVFGGDDNGLMVDDTVVQSVEALSKVMDGLPKSIEASLQIKGLYHTKSLADSKKLSEELANFESHFKESSLGLGVTDLTGEFTPINAIPVNISRDVYGFLKETIQERYGVSPEIMSGNYTGEQFSAFYQTVIEPFIVEFEQAFTDGCFTEREKAFGHTIKVYYSRVSHLATSDKLKLAEIAENTGVMTLNMIAEMFGILPFEGGDRRVQSLNYVSLGMADQYQMGRIGGSTTAETDSATVEGEDDAE